MRHSAEHYGAMNCSGKKGFPEKSMNEREEASPDKCVTFKKKARRRRRRNDDNFKISIAALVVKQNCKSAFFRRNRRLDASRRE